MKGLVLHDISKHFGGVAAVQNLSMHTEPGTITGLIGPNGAGKTTIVNLITGMLGVTGGRIEFDGCDITTLTARDIARLGVARTFQNIRLLKEASVIDNVVVGYHRHESSGTLANLLGLPSARAERVDFYERARKLMAMFDMGDYEHHPAAFLSYGHQRRVEMMRALATDPKLLLLDEPVAGMNDVEGEYLGRIFRRLADEGISVLLIEHNMRFVRSLCDHVYVVDSGCLIAEGSADHVINHPDVVQAYLGA